MNIWMTCECGAEYLGDYCIFCFEESLRRVAERVSPLINAERAKRGLPPIKWE